MKYTQEQIIELAKEVELTDAIDWENLPLEKDRIYQIIGSQAYELYANYSQSEDGEAILIATVTKLLVENFVLNLKVQNL
jgi:alanine-alpha-ketoisovalerate/valine-pyruvate aminotransferase